MVNRIFKQFLFEIQNSLRELIKFQRIDIKKIDYVLALDIAYKKDIGIAVGVVYDIKNKTTVEKIHVKDKVEFPYIPGLLFFREAPLTLEVIRRIKSRYDLILVDAHGYAHPRRMGLATVIGIITKKPTIGIAKSILVGKLKKINDKISEIVDKNELIGYEIRGDRKFYVSPGSNIDFDSTLEFIKMLDFKYPEALRIADRLSKRYKNDI